MKPILFSTEMVNAILEGSKSQTRRIVKFPKDYTGGEVYLNGQFGLKYESNLMGETVQRLAPKCEVGDILWVREQMYQVWEDSVYYSADGKEWEDHPEDYHYRNSACTVPSIHMPYKACRIWLEITGIGVERLQDISEGDSIAEGIDLSKTSGDFETTPRWVYKELWEKINGKYSWEANPWVWVIKFSKTDKP